MYICKEWFDKYKSIANEIIYPANSSSSDTLKTIGNIKI